MWEALCETVQTEIEVVIHELLVLHWCGWSLLEKKMINIKGFQSGLHTTYNITKVWTKCFCSMEEVTAKGFRTTWSSVNYDRITFLGELKNKITYKVLLVALTLRYIFLISEWEEVAAVGDDGQQGTVMSDKREEYMRATSSTVLERGNTIPDKTRTMTMNEVR